MTAALPRLVRPTLFARARRGRTDSTSRARRLEAQEAPGVPAERTASRSSWARGALRAGLREAKRPAAPLPFRSRLPATDRRRGPPRPTQPAAPRPAGATACDHARRKPAHTGRSGRGCRHGFRLASSTASLAAARMRGPMKHRRSRPTDLSRGAVSSGAHGLQIWACRARSPRIVQLVSALLRRAVCSSPYVPARWSTVAPNEGRSRQPVVGVGGRSARPAGSPRECPGGR